MIRFVYVDCGLLYAEKMGRMNEQNHGQASSIASVSKWELVSVI